VVFNVKAYIKNSLTDLRLSGYFKIYKITISKADKDKSFNLKSFSYG